MPNSGSVLGSKALGLSVERWFAFNKGSSLYLSRKRKFEQYTMVTQTSSVMMSSLSPLYFNGAQDLRENLPYWRCGIPGLSDQNELIATCRYY